MSGPTVDHLLAEVEEEYDASGALALHQFGWSLAGLGKSRTDADFEAMCHTALAVFRDRHPDAVVVRLPWPTDLSQARPIPADEVLVLDAGPDGPPSWHQALVPGSHVAGTPGECGR